MNCRGCKQRFTTLRRKHHCRACGKIFCNECSSERTQVRGSTHQKRVCQWCLLKLVPQGFNRISFHGNSSVKPEHNSVKTVQELLHLKEENRSCADCGGSNPEWASISHGMLICLRCSGRHRGLGTHVSFVRSLKLDVLSPEDIDFIRKGGNAAFKEFVPADWHKKRWREKKDLYESKAFAAYRQELRESVEKSVEKNEDSMPDAFRRARGISLSEQTSAERPVTYVGSRSMSKRKMKTRMQKQKASWIDDKNAPNCMHCGKLFTLLRRRHHCRKCGACLCNNCAPGNNVRPVPENGYTTSVRVCLRCFNPDRRLIKKAPSERST